MRCSCVGNLLLVVVILQAALWLGASAARGGEAKDPGDWLVVNALPVKRGMDLKIPGLRNPEFAAYAAVRFGADSNDVAYLVFDCKERLKPYDVLHVYVPGHRKYGKVTRVSGRRKEKSRVFRNLSLEGMYGSMQHKCGLAISTRTRWDGDVLEVFVEAECSLRDPRTRKKSTFRLRGPVKVTLNSAVEIPCASLVQRPRLSVRWDHRSDPPHVRGRICMGSLSMDPEAGFRRKAAVEVRVRKAEKPQYRRSFNIEPSGARGEFCHYARTRFRKSTEYQVSLTVDLGPHFRAITATDQMVLR